MSKSLIPTKLYKDITKLLYNEGLIKVIPPQKWTTDSSAYGYLRTHYMQNRVTGAIREEYVGLYLNKNYCPCTVNDFLTKPDWAIKNFIELIDTICHELAHMTYHDHSKGHKDLTEKYKDLVMTNLLPSPDIVTDYIMDCKVK